MTSYHSPHSNQNPNSHTNPDPKPNPVRNQIDLNAKLADERSACTKIILEAESNFAKQSEMEKLLVIEAIRVRVRIRVMFLLIEAIGLGVGQGSLL